MPKLRKFIDLDMNFEKHPISDDVSRKFDVSAIIKSVKHLVLSNYYERPFHPEIGSSVRALLFENDNAFTQGLIRDAIKQVIENYEPRVKDSEVVVETDPSGNNYLVSIFLKVTGLLEPVDMTISLERVR